MGYKYQRLISLWGGKGKAGGILAYCKRADSQNLKWFDSILKYFNIIAVRDESKAIFFTGKSVASRLPSRWKKTQTSKGLVTNDLHNILLMTFAYQKHYYRVRALSEKKKKIESSHTI